MKIKFENIDKSPIKGIEIDCINEKAFLDEIIEDGDIIYVNTYTELKPSQIPQLIEWLQKVNTYIEQNKTNSKEMTIEEIEKEIK
ncbi:hypothetical protein [Clostridium sp. M14]|uniref:hypothetical protein n=1 Tax=Clostridium sp. M14 TaxID=2716311 RepID=UPI0013EE6F3C|nr:hypothetical protein [Clostridium sp. M14]MBZ9693233.1 hypothetical protein [Clostridium sp. M14]